MIRVTLRLLAAVAGLALCGTASAQSMPTTNLKEWYVAGTGVTASGGRISAWADQSGNGYSASQGTAANQPYDATDAAGNPIVRFPYGTTCTLTSNGFAYDARAISIWVVMRGNPGISVAINGYAQAFSPHFATFSNGSTPPTLRLNTTNSQFYIPMNLGVYGTVSGASGQTAHDATGSQALTTAFADATNTGGVAITGTADIYEILVYGAAQSAQDQADTKAYLVAKYGVPTTAPANVIAFEGDSITYGLGVAGNQSYPFMLSNIPGIAANWRVFNFGSSGSTVSTLSSRTATQNLLSGITATRKVLAVQIGRNDVSDAGFTTSQAIYDNLETYLAAQAAAVTGLEIWQQTNISDGNTTLQTRLTDYVALIRANLKTDVPQTTAIVELREDPRFAPATFVGTSATYYQAGGTHITEAGNQAVANVLKPYFYADGYTISGPVGDVYTVTRAAGTFNSAESVTLTASAGTIDATAASGVITDDSTSAVTVTPADGTSSFTFVPSGAATITPTNGQDWGDADAVEYAPASSPRGPGLSIGIGIGIEFGH